MHWSRLSAFLALATIAFSSSTSEAFTRKSPAENWFGSGIVMVRNRYSIPDAYPWKAGYDSAAWYWNQSASAFSYWWLYDDPWISMGNGRNELARVPRSSITNASNGQCQCLSSLGIVSECDIMIADDVSFSPYDESWFQYPGDGGPGQGSLGTIVHEMGHFVGLDHPSPPTFAVMHPSPMPEAGGDTYEPMGDDALGIKSWPLQGNLYQENVLASAQYLNPSGLIKKNNLPITRYAARGGLFSLRYSVSNPGSTSRWAPLRVLISAASPVDYYGGIPLFVGSVWLPAGSYYSETLTLTVPSSTPVGTYWIMWTTDPAGTFAEYSEADNGVHSPMVVQVY